MTLNPEDLCKEKPRKAEGSTDWDVAWRGLAEQAQARRGREEAARVGLDEGI